MGRKKKVSQFDHLGMQLVDLMGLHIMDDGKIDTSWGDKTPAELGQIVWVMCIET